MSKEIICFKFKKGRQLFFQKCVKKGAAGLVLLRHKSIKYKVASLRKYTCYELAEPTVERTVLPTQLLLRELR